MWIIELCMIGLAFGGIIAGNIPLALIGTIGLMITASMENEK